MVTLRKIIPVLIVVLGVFSFIEADDQIRLELETDLENKFFKGGQTVNVRVTHNENGGQQISIQGYLSLDEGKTWKKFRGPRNARKRKSIDFNPWTISSNFS